MSIQQFIEKAKRDYMRSPQEWIPTHYPHLNGDSYYTNVLFQSAMLQPRVDAPDLPLVAKYRWYMKDGYAVTSIAGKRIKMHHLIVGKPPAGKEVDHENKDRLDNRRANLRFLTRQQNAKNHSVGKGYRQRGKRWEAYIQADGKQTYLGTFDTEIQAEEAHLEAKKHYHAV